MPNTNILFSAIFSLVLWQQLTACVATQQAPQPHQVQQQTVEILQIIRDREQEYGGAWFEDV